MHLKVKAHLFFALLSCSQLTASCSDKSVDSTTDSPMLPMLPPPPKVPPAICANPHTEPVGRMGGRLFVSLMESLELGGTSLEIPAGALNTGTNVQITCGDELAVPPTETAVGPSVRILPAEQTLGNLATLVLPYDPSKVPADAEVLVAVRTGDQISHLGSPSVSIDPVNGSISIGIQRFGDYQVLTVPSVVPNPPPLGKNVDVLFVVDNSPSMAPKQQALAASLPKLIQSLDALNVDYHIGITTTDVGSTVAPGKLWGSIGTCDTYEGDDGVLQNLPCTVRVNGSAATRNACAMYCPDDRFVPTDGKRYIAKENGLTNVPQDLRLDPMTGNTVDYGPINAARCMAIVGDGGCGIEGTLEGSRRALDGHSPDNHGFLRSGSLLVVIFLTDEDDCSVRLARRSENNPLTKDCSTPDQNASYDCYGVDYRCLARSVICDEPMNSPGSKTNCRERPNSYLEPLDTYARFFRGLLKDHRLLISGIWTQPSISKGGKLVISRGNIGSSSAYLNRAGGMDASCFSASDPNIFGQAQLRLSAFASAVPNAQQYSICSLDELGTAFGNLAKAIADNIGK